VKWTKPNKTHNGHWRARVIYRVGGSKVACLVEIVRRYANRLDLAGELARAVGRMTVRGAAAAAEAGPYEVGAAQRGRQRHVLAAMPEDAVEQIVSSFAAGTPKHRLAAEYGMSLSSIKRLLRRARAQVEPAFVAPA
jgi:DNA-directed RNA polymerase specialized sigma24 family protein